MTKSSAGGLVRRLPRAPSSLRCTSSCASPTSASAASSSSSASAPVTISQVGDNFTLPAGSPALTPETRTLEPLPDHDAASDACSAAPGRGGRRPDEFELIPAATSRRLRRTAFWGYVRAVALAVRVAVLAATLAVVVTADVALSIHLFPRRGAT